MTLLPLYRTNVLKASKHEFLIGLRCFLTVGPGWKSFFQGYTFNWKVDLDGLNALGTVSGYDVLYRIEGDRVFFHYHSLAGGKTNE